MKKSKKKPVKIKKETVDTLIDLAHQGTQESVEKISALTKKTKNNDLLAMVRIAGDEAKLFYYEPANQDEERDLLLAWLIWKKENEINDRQIKLDNLKGESKCLQTQDLVHQKIMKSKVANKDWQYYSSEYFALPQIGNEIAQIEDDISYAEIFIEEAEKMIKNEKYRKMPVGFFQSYHWDWEGGNFVNDDFDDEADDWEF